LKLNQKRIISEKSFSIDKIMIKSIELREYKLLPVDDKYNNEKEKYFIYLAVITDKGQIEVDYLGKPTEDKDTFDECFNFLCNYQGISSTLNRIILEIQNNKI
jgi:hypothetical protein